MFGPPIHGVLENLKKWYVKLSVIIFKTQFGVGWD
jgi:hypothetical protein